MPPSTRRARSPAADPLAPNIRGAGRRILVSVEVPAISPIMSIFSGVDVTARPRGPPSRLPFFWMLASSGRLSLQLGLLTARMCPSWSTPESTATAGCSVATLRCQALDQRLEVRTAQNARGTISNSSAATG